ncbi:unnamed protein product [Vitrella brassicaformis CCMP3155]|uniref:Uncharacterized protein n=2 Tax=Vitrella brassicaformis TaxID=1169539 RepID=A0A0G4FDS0_VITBC|nr:unnamed protein product [Vitrella brassicaformis CCMP3155]|eukprot:CEM11328.1 unnamed protein product [Vitrella brassicaformis CCMP3155]
MSVFACRRLSTSRVHHIPLPLFEEATKFFLRKPKIEGATYDDIQLKEPSKDDLAKFSKESGKFLRFLKIWCEEDGRGQQWVEYVKQYDTTGHLTVERDVYLTRDEVSSAMIESGYDYKEVYALETFFSPDDKFHYPEISILFNIDEQHTYEYCMRVRARNHSVVAVKEERRPALVRSYALFFAAVAFFFSYTPLSSYIFIGKLIPSTLLYYFLVFQGLGMPLDAAMRQISRLACEKQMMTVLDGEEAIAMRMRDFAQDGECLKSLNEFKGEAQASLIAYHKALVVRQKQALKEKLSRQLLSIQQAEASIGASLQDVMVRELVKMFRETFPKDAQLQDAALKSAIANIAGDKVQDPIAGKFLSALKDLSAADLEKTKGNEAGTLVERVAAVFQQKEKDFLSNFTVKGEEVSELKQIIAKIKTGTADGYDFKKLDTATSQKLDSLYSSINARMGFDVADERMITVTTQDTMPIHDAGAADFVEAVNAKVAASADKIRTNRLTAFLKAFD